ncbi:hypothetical protein K9M74_02245 [Candidatus Woesearchaeota archaeon]|nr:hypothetical protein [Candidatus Woesearchaeota archaeon]
MENQLRFSTQLVKLIKEKPELATLDDAFIEKIILQKNFQIPDKYETFEKFKKSAICKNIVSQTRKNLRELYGVFMRKQLAKNNFDDVDTILQAHQSTNERYDYIGTIYDLLFDKLVAKGLPEKFSLLDVACGFTPFTLDYFPLRPQEYIACDLSSSDMARVTTFFKKKNQQGYGKAIDVVSEDFLLWVKGFAVDVCFLFKALDSFELRERNVSKLILSRISASFFVVSFSLVSIGGKNIIGAQRRTWFEKFCVKQGWSYETLQIPNELFYIVSKT